MESTSLRVPFNEGRSQPLSPFSLPTMPSSPRSPSSPSSDNSFPILAIAIIGILITSFLLICYYVFVINCCFTWNRFSILRHFSSGRQHDRPFNVYAAEAENRGLDESVIRSIPIIRFKRAEGIGTADGQGSENNNNSLECAVCLSEFKEDERLRRLPHCTHIFHIDCIDAWLQTNANCPLCRSSISSASHFSNGQIAPHQPFCDLHLITNHEDIIVELNGDSSVEAPGSTDEEIRVQVQPSPRKLEQRTLPKKQRKLHHASSMGDECIDVRGKKDDQFSIQPIRRSFSMDSSTDRQLYLSVQEILQKNPQFHEINTSEDTGSCKIRRSFFSFGHVRGSSKNAILPL